MQSYIKIRFEIPSTIIPLVEAALSSLSITKLSPSLWLFTMHHQFVTNKFEIATGFHKWYFTEFLPNLASKLLKTAIDIYLISTLRPENTFVAFIRCFLLIKIDQPVVMKGISLKQLGLTIYQSGSTIHSWTSYIHHKFKFWTIRGSSKHTNL